MPLKPTRRAPARHGLCSRPTSADGSGRRPRPPGAAAALARAVRGPAESLESLESRLLFSVIRDFNGFTVPVPSPDSRIVYVSSTGSDQNAGFSPSSPVQTIAAGRALLRSGFPDYLLLRRGDAFTGTGNNLTAWTLSGRSADEPMVIGAYTDPARPSAERPKLLTGISSGFANQASTANHPLVSYLDLIGVGFESDRRNYRQPPPGRFTTDFNSDAVGGDYGINVFGSVSSFLVEDCSFQYYRSGIVIQNSSTFGNPTDIRVRRNQVLDSYAVSFDPAGNFITSEGIYCEGVQGLTLEENVFDHNGWTDPAYAALGAIPSIFNHDAYLNIGNTNVVVTGNVFANAASHGLQARAGGIVTNNLFIGDPIGMSYGYVNGQEVAGGVSGQITGNVYYGSRDIAGSPRGWGLEISNLRPAANGGGTIVRDNVYASYPTNGQPAIQFTVGNNTVNPDQSVGINDLLVQNNIVYNWTKGVSTNASMVSGGTGRKSINGLVVANNDFQTTAATPVVEHNNGFNGAAEAWRNNRYDSVKADNGSTPYFKVQNSTMGIGGWQALAEPTASDTHVFYPDPNRSPASYNASLGGVPSLDGYLAQVRLQSTAYWRPQYLPSAVLGYLKAGFAGRRLETAAPTATLSAAPLTTGGPATYTFNVTYTDDNQINTATLGNGDVLVTGPGGYSQAAALVSVNTSSDRSTSTVTYSVPAPNGAAWDATANGSYAVAVQPGQVTDTAGRPVPAATIGSFVVNIDVSTPTASLSAPNVGASGTPATLTVTYAANATSAPAPMPLSNPGFETPALGAGVAFYNPAGASWTFTGTGDATAGAGISGNGASFTAGNPAAPEGAQVAFVQGGGSLSQTIPDWPAGAYVLSLMAAQRGNSPGGPSNEDVQVLIDGAAIATLRPAGTAYTRYITAPFAVAAGPHTLTLQGLNSAGGDNTVLLDAVQVSTLTPGGAIAVGSLDSNDLLVTGPGGFNATARFVSADTFADGSPRVATYVIDPPAGGWSGAANGMYTVSTRAGQVLTTGGVGIGATTLGGFVVAVTPPSAAASAADISGPTTSPQTITVTYTDPKGVNAASIDSNDLRVLGPGGFVSGVTLVSVSGTGTGGSPLIATYSLAAPAGGWQGANNGTYYIVPQAGEVTNLDGNALPPTAIGTFRVSVDAYPPVAVANSANVTLPGIPSTGTTKTINVVYNDATGVNTSMLGTGDITLTDPAGNVTVPTFTGSSTSGTSVTATYVFNIPAGGWLPANNGKYTITLGAGEVADVLGNAVLRQTIGSFSVAIDTTPPKATVSAPDVTIPTAAATISVTYTDADPGVNVATLDSGDIIVTGPNGFVSPVTLQSVSSTTNGSPRTAVYVLAAPGGSWLGKNGPYQVIVQANQVADVAGNYMPQTTIGGFNVNIDTTPPTAQVAAVTPNPRSAPLDTLTIVFSEPVTGFDLSDLTLSRDGGPNLLTSSQTLTTTDNKTFVLGGLSALTTAPGTYTLTINAPNSGIADRAGNLMVASASGGFVLDNSGPTAVGSGATIVNPSASSETFAVTYADPAGVNVATLDSNDLFVSGPNGYSAAATFVSVSPSGNGTPRTATYTVPAPAGGWTSAYNGTYAIAVQVNQVADVLGNFMPPGFVGSFTVNIAPDTTAPTVTISPVIPTPRTAPVDSIAITFSKPIVGFDLSDLALTRDGGPNLIDPSGATQALTTSDNVHWMLSGLSPVTTPNGTYRLTLDAAASGITDATGTPLANSGATTFVVDASSSGAVVMPTVNNFGFESPPVGSGAGAYQVAPADPVWAYTGFCGVAGPASDLTTGSPAAPEGVQVGFLQGPAAISQLVSGWQAGTFVITLQAAQRATIPGPDGPQAIQSAQGFQVLVDNSVVGTFQPGGTNYSQYISRPFTVAAGGHTITLQGLPGAGGAAANDAALIDAIQVNLAPSLPRGVTVSPDAQFTFANGTFTLSAGTATFAQDNQGDGVGVAATGSGTRVVFNTTEHLTGLTLGGGATAAIPGVGTARTAANHRILVVGALSIDAASGSQLDLADNDLVLKNGGAAGLASIQSLVSAGYNKHNWNGNGIITSAAAGKTTNALGYALNDGSVIKAKTTFGPNVASNGGAPETLGNTDVLVKYTWEGDANLDGQVSFDDNFYIDSKYPRPAASTWVMGDFDYNGVTSFDDYFYIDSNYPRSNAL